ncbi:MFS transporter [Iningainema tapete]|uniref:MFS transporter n=1 Tax=Iningainema tapete TaxID=2806730 RepID=UPI00307FF691
MDTLSVPIEIQSPVAADLAAKKISKQAIRTSLKASTLDGVFATIFSNIAGGVLLINFLLQLGATPVEIGFLSSIPMVMNFLQPLGAYFADRTQSRRNYIRTLVGLSRLLWLVLVALIALYSWFNTDPHLLVTSTLIIIFICNILNALGCSAWLSWMAVLVPQGIRGRYFGFRNSAVSLTNLLVVPLLGFAVSALPGDIISGYGVLLIVGVAIGLVSLGCQGWMTDVNPVSSPCVDSQAQQQESDNQPEISILKDTNFLKFLLYVGLWMFAVNLSSPFFNLYMMKNLALDLSTVTVYTSLVSGANIVMLRFWGKLADRIGNRPLLLLVGIPIAITPVLWFGIGADSVSVWVWLPLMYLFWGGFGDAIDLCYNNLQMSLASENRRPSKYFALTAAVSGVGGGLGSTMGGFLAGLDITGGLLGLFALSAIVRLIALLPLVFVHEKHSQPVFQVLRNLLPFKPEQVEAIGEQKPEVIVALVK